MREIIVTAASVFASYVIVIVIFVVIFFNVIRPYFDWYPSYWEKGGKKYSTIDITDNAEFIKRMVYNLWDPEEVGIGRDAQEVGNNIYIKITSVERVENLPLFREYNVKRQSLLQKKDKIKRIKDLSELSGSGIQTTNLINAVPQLLDSHLEVDILHDINEHYLFHGTSSENVESICREGLKIQYAGKGLFGKGIYAAEDPTKSDQYTDPRGNNGKTILLCRADLGEMWVADRPAKELKSPPCRTPKCYKQNCKEHKYTFDSAVGDIPGYRYREFILYKNHRIYPEYIITYDRTEDPTEMMAYKSA